MVCEWRTCFFENGGEIPEGKQGKYKRTGILWNNEQLNEMAAKFVRENADVNPNLTASSFCQWVTRTSFRTRHWNKGILKTLRFKLRKDGCTNWGLKR